MRKIIPYLLLALIFFSNAEASVMQPGDGPYWTLRRARTLYIYDEKSREFIESLAAYEQSFRLLYDKSYGWELDEEADLILASPRQQIANAYATVFPNIKTVWFPSGVGMLDEMAESSWALTLASHEIAHLYQLNAKNGLNARLAPVFGNSLMVLPFVWPVFLQPNIFLPNSFMEGNAVLNESRLNMGGRLHSGEKRALVLAQVADKKLDASRLINSEFKFPFGEAAYLFGGYFQAHLAGKYGIDKTNQFFVAQASHYLWPFIINKTFRGHFGSSFYQEAAEFVHGLESLAARQRAAEQDPVSEAIFSGALNHDSGRIFWLDHEVSGRAVLRVFDKGSKKLESRDIDLPSGKIFFDGETPLSATSEQHDLHHLEYSLYGEGARLDRRYTGQIVNDRRAGKTVALDARESWLEGRLLLDGEPYDVAHSQPILDESGHVYYFRQNGSERLLYRDRAPLAKYDGFYGKLTEASADGDVYFVGNTDYGSTLFMFRGQEIYRVVDSDRVVDARRISADEFLIAEVTSSGHQSVVVPARMRAERPAVYSYAFANQNVLPVKMQDTEQTKSDERPYSAWRELRYSSADVSAAYAGKPGFYLSTALNFTDPLEHQTVTAGFAGSALRDRSAFAQYTYTKYLPQFFSRYFYSEDWYRRDDGGERRAHSQEVWLGAGLPLWRWRRWDAGLLAAVVYRTEQPAAKTQPVPEDLPDEQRYGLISRFQVSNVVPSTLGFFPWRLIELSYTHKLDTQPGLWTKDNNTSLLQLRFSHEIIDQIYASVFAQGAWAETHDIKVEYNPAPESSEIRLHKLTGEEEYKVRSAVLGRLEVHKAFVVPLYSNRIPFGLNRLAPFGVVQQIAMDDDPLDEYPAQIFEFGYGADLEVLILHKFPARIRYLRAVDSSKTSSKDFELRLDFKRDF